MFVQVIEGKVGDRDALRRQMDRWMTDLRPGAKGFLGSTAGVADDSTVIVFARFESGGAAKANNDRPEQGQWWSETEKAFAGPVSFSDSEDVETFLGGGSNDAGFVQVMKGSADRDRIRAVDQAFEQHAKSFRPDLIGYLRLWMGPQSYVEVAYFTSEEAARAGEQQEPPPELRSTMGEFEQVMAGAQYIDLKDPWLF